MTYWRKQMQSPELTAFRVIWLGVTLALFASAAGLLIWGWQVGLGMLAAFAIAMIGAFLYIAPIYPGDVG